ncbi:MAG: SAM-dependent methyltransferase [Pseudomonadota bacterium]
MTPLARLIADQIAKTGPISLAEYMALALGHPQHGYYCRRDPLGQAGDFTTAPEISQMFGEMIGLWLLSIWQSAGKPAPFRLVELGPGRGTLMADALRAARLDPGFAVAADLWLVETSPVLRAAQAERLPQAAWADTVTEVPTGPMLLVANEFFDALPVHQFLRSPEGWREVCVGLEDGHLTRGLSAPLPGPEDGEWREESPLADRIAEEIARRIATDGGAAMIVDYGYTTADRPPGPTLQALRNKAPADPLDTPGSADLTWLIDFDHLADRLSPLAAWRTTQGAFLASLGIGQRAAALARARPTEATTIADALERLTAPEHMGQLFKVLAALPHGQSPPAGFP